MPTITKSTSSLTKLSSLRWLVGFLGSKKQFGWWDCSFLDETGIRFLSTTFPRSAHSAAIQATSEAAQRIHVGSNDLGLRQCLETNVDISWKKIQTCRT